ncbi:MAG: HAD-IC family P-type ATPase [Candidatus Jettenia caeni]|nr:HAD-IC family P-type ATPase [Candidatus Jettenia caeni]WKZ15210.1 MAG: HAD-IC family P-type ATPase [Candidatus Jettenia caeni]
MNWYQLSIKETLQRLQTSEDGLTDEEAKERLKQYGQNKLAEEEKISKIKIFFHQFTSPLVYILLVTAVVTFLFKEYIDATVIIAIVVINAIIGYIQEFKAEQSVRALKKMVVPKARVLRNGKEKEIHSEELVPGDIVLLTSGVKVPADLRLIRTVELRVEEAMLTGESVPAEKVVVPIKEDNLTPGDQRNMAFMGTIVISGRAKGVIVETSSKTVLGSIAQEVKQVGVTKAPLQKKIENFAKVIGLITLATSVLLFIIGVIVGESVKDMFMTAVAATVAAIPEGLPIVVTIAMAIAVARMARQNAIVRKLPAAETLGSTTVICSDKTGTLTKNEMTVKLVYDGKHTYEVTGSGYEPKGEILHEDMPIEAKEKKILLQVLRIGLLCNESNIYEEEDQYKVDGDPTEAALIVSSMKAGLSQEEEKRHYPQIGIIPFESERGYMATLHKHGGKKFIFVKGAPEKVLDMCTACMAADNLNKKEISHIAANFAKEGLRVLAFAYKEVPHDTEEISHHDIESDLILAGLQGMMDPPRPESIEAVKGCKKAGIRVVMITGDHAVTAKAIAKRLDIIGENADVLTGKELNEMNDSTLFEKVKTVSIYARVAPEHKLRIVKQLKKHGEIVAVTGDGVNDAPALKEAHIGIAMGRTGTDVAKEASDMVLTDDNFATMFNAVKEGRVLFDNIRKVVFFLIPTGIAAILSIIATIILGVPMPYVPTQLLWLNIVTNGLQDIALAFEPGEKGVIDRPPRNPKEGIMSRVLIERTILVSFVISLGVIFNFISALHEGVPIEKARTTALTTMVFFQFFQAWNSRSETQSVFRMNPISNPFLFYSMIAAIFAQLAVLYVPPLQWIFRTQPLTSSEWIHVGIASVTIIVIIEFDKWIRRRKGKAAVIEAGRRKILTPANILLSFVCIFLMLWIAYTFFRPKKEDEIVFSIGAESKEIDFIRNLLNDFEDKNPSIKVKLNILPAPTDQQHHYYLTTLGARSTDIDVLRVDTIWIAEFASAGWLEPLETYINPGYKASFIPIIDKTNRYRDRLYAIPWNADIGLFYYRRDLLKKYQVSPPKTWEELIEIGTKISPTEPVYGYLWQGKQYEGLVCNFIEFIGSNNGEIINEEGKIVVNSPQNKIALDLMHDLIWKYRISPPNTPGELMEESSRHLFQQEKGLFLRNWTYVWDLSQRDQSTKGKIGVTRLPRFPDGKSTSVYAGWHLAINTNSMKKEQAWQLINFLTSRRIQKELALHLAWAPTRNALYKNPRLLRKLPFLPIVEESFHTIQIRPNLPYYQRISDVIQNEVNKVLSNQLDSQKALQTIQTELERVQHEFIKD